MRIKPEIVDAVLALDSSAKVTINGTDIDTCTFDWETTEISRADIKTKLEELTATYDGLQYARNRLVAYPSLTDFAEAYCEKEIGGDSTKWDAYVVNYNKVRSDNPKE
jgi:hypothetical protein